MGRAGDPPGHADACDYDGVCRIVPCVAELCFRAGGGGLCGAGGMVLTGRELRPSVMVSCSN